MIIKSSQREGAQALSIHLSSSDNESVSIIQSYQLVSSNSIYSALAEMEALSKASRCKKHIYHVSISPDTTEKMRHDIYVS